MDHIDKPDFHIKEVFENCISKVRNPIMKKNLQDCVKELEDDENVYERLAKSKRLHVFTRKDVVGKSISNKDMKKVYTQRMVPKDSPGRDFYDKILSLADNCPFCSTRIVSTLDHYLPKGAYSSLVVTPINLIPSCSDCNKTKLEKMPTSVEELTLHPYYDDVNNDIWLYARLIQSDCPVFEFYVNPPVDWDLVLKKRIQYHFDVFQLGKLYSLHSVLEFNGIKQYLYTLYKKGGKGQVKSYLKDIEQSWSGANRNTWQAAMYRALAEDEWLIDDYLMNNI